MPTHTHSDSQKDKECNPALVIIMLKGLIWRPSLLLFQVVEEAGRNTGWLFSLAYLGKVSNCLHCPYFCLWLPFLEKERTKAPLRKWVFGLRPHSCLSKTWKWCFLLTFNLHFNISAFAPSLVPLRSVQLWKHLPHIWTVSTLSLRKCVAGQESLLKRMHAISFFKNGYLIICVLDWVVVFWTYINNWVKNTIERIFKDIFRNYNFIAEQVLRKVFCCLLITYLLDFYSNCFCK